MVDSQVLHVPADSGELDPAAVADVCVAAGRALRAVDDDQQAVDRALDVLWRAFGPDLLVSVYVLDLDRLWLVAQRGYDQVRDGFALGQGVMGRAVREGRAQIVPDVEADPDFIAATSLLRSEIALPLGAGRPAKGVFNIETRTRTLTERQRAPFEALAAQIAARLGPALDPAGADMASLARLFVYASSLRDVSGIAELAVRAVGRLLGADSAQLNLLDGSVYAEQACFWRPRASPAEPLSPSLLGQLRANEPVNASLTLIDMREARLSSPELPRRVAWLPLRVGGEELGTLTAAAHSLAPAAEQTETAMLLAAHFAALLDATLALERERLLANHDPLTNLLNRRGFDERFAAELTRAKTERSILSLLVIDCDNLKDLNELGGHALGDSALQAIAAGLRTHGRSGDTTARLGGDEFAILLPDLTHDDRDAIAERIRYACESSSLRRGRLTVSIGQATWPDDGGSAAEILHAADIALYAAKHAGKNRSAAPHHPVGAG